jgi:hypothetical protein
MTGSHGPALGVGLLVGFAAGCLAMWLGTSTDAAPDASASSDRPVIDDALARDLRECRRALQEAYEQPSRPAEPRPAPPPSEVASAPPASAPPFPADGSYSPEKLSEFLWEWEQDCPAVGRAMVDANCDAYPCEVLISWDRDAADVLDIWCSDDRFDRNIGFSIEAGGKAVTGSLFLFAPADYDAVSQFDMRARLNELTSDPEVIQGLFESAGNE